MNYLQIPRGSGSGQRFDFDIARFASNFKLNAFEITYILQVLASEEIILFTEMSFAPSTLVFDIDKQTLVDYELQNPSLEPVIKGLLRSYEGIFDFPSPIYESQLARFLSLPLEKVFEVLQQLHNDGIIIYKRQKDCPQIILLKDRMYKEAFKVNTDNLRQRKLHYTERLKNMIGYALNTKDCRSQLIGNYFTDPAIKPCGVCDNCIREKNTSVTDNEFIEISRKIKGALEGQKLSRENLLEKLKPVSKQKFGKVFQFLLSESHFTIDQKGEISLKESKGQDIKKGPR
jgi:ATP-dependent DNA helicase RecQ